MTVVRATFDGEVFRPHERPALAPDTEVDLTFHPREPKLGEPYSLLDYLESLKLQGPPDWSSRFDDDPFGAADEREE